MSRLIFNHFSGTFELVLDQASEIAVDDTGLDITAATVQEAVEELDASIAAIPTPLHYVGTWNATTNSPALANTDTGVEGFLYQVNVAGSVDFGAGSISFSVGDKVANNGSIWEKWDMTDAVTSVNGDTGAVTLTTSDIAEGSNLYYTDARVLAYADETQTPSTVVKRDSDGAIYADYIASTAEVGLIAGVGSDGSVLLAPDGTGNIICSSKKITDVATPVSSDDAATKGYVDGLVGGNTNPKREMQLFKNHGAATVTAVGFTAPTLTTATNGEANDGCWLTHSTTTTTGNTSGHTTAFNLFNGGWKPELYTRIKTGADITNTRIWFGLSSASLDAVTTPTTEHVAAFRFDTTVHGTNFYAVTNSLTGLTATQITGVTVAINTIYNLSILITDAGNAEFYIDDVLVASQGFVGGSTNLGYICRIRNLASAIKTMKWARLVFRHH